jgi:hypothetical protein
MNIMATALRFQWKRRNSHLAGGLPIDQAACRVNKTLMDNTASRLARWILVPRGEHRTAPSAAGLVPAGGALASR